MGVGGWGIWGIRGGALALAVLLWLYAVTEHVYSTEVWARLYVHDPAPVAGERQLVVANTVPEAVRIRVTGKGKDLLRLDEGSYALHLKPDGGAGGTRSVRLAPDMVEAREDVRSTVELVLEPQEVEISLDWRAQRAVPVVSRVSTELSDSYVIVGEPRIEPRMVEISGPSAQIRMVTRVETEALTLRGVQEDVDRYVGLVAPAGVRCRVDPQRVRVKLDVQILAQDELVGVPISVRNQGARVRRAEPGSARVRVRGGIEVLAEIDPQRDAGLYVDALEDQGDPLRIQHDETQPFEVVEIQPTHAQLVDR